MNQLYKILSKIENTPKIRIQRLALEMNMNKLNLLN